MLPYVVASTLASLLSLGASASVQPEKAVINRIVQRTSVYFVFIVITLNAGGWCCMRIGNVVF